MSDWQTRDLISDSVNPVCGSSCALVSDVASKVAPRDEPHATHVTHARVQPQTGSHSPKLKPGFVSPKLKSSEIGRTSLTVHVTLASALSNSGPVPGQAKTVSHCPGSARSEISLMTR
jgi:hypothetical protein